jgi:hypothetical protein
MRYLITLIGLLALLVHGCKPCDDVTDPECPNYDPCYEVIPTSAEFDMIEVISRRTPIEIPIVTGKHLYIHTLRLAPKDTTPGLKHQWIIGREPTPREQDIEFVTFSSLNIGRSITITHIVESEARTGCFPEDDGRDTVVKEVQIVGYLPDYTPDGLYTPLPIHGVYTGHMTFAPEREFTMGIEWVDSETVPGNTSYTQLVNFPEGCFNFKYELVPAGNGFVWIGTYYADIEVCLAANTIVGRLADAGDSLYIDFDYYISEPVPPGVLLDESEERSSTFNVSFG